MHAHGQQRTTRVLQLSLAATLLYIAVTIYFGIRANSLALLSEAGHNASDFLALLLSWLAVYFHARPATSTKTFGYGRAGVLAAFVNALMLVLITFYLFYEAFERLYQPAEVHPREMIWVAAVGVVMNASIAFALYRSGRDVNLRSALLHEVGDTLSTAAVILGGWAILRTGQQWIDPALSVAIGLMILWSSWGIIRETLNILLEGTPRGIELELIAQVLREIEGVNEVHDLHVWSLGSETHALSCHIGIDDIPPSASERILRQVNDCLASRFHIHHSTIQFEHAACEVAEGCVLPAPGAHSHSR